jgi:hypothetical protein
MNPRVISVIPKDNYMLELHFDNGQTGFFDVRSFLDMPVFIPLKDKDYFSKARSMFGAVVWPDGQDICPDTLYEDSIK